MRSISAAALATISEPYGVEPVTLIKVYWTATTIVWYGAKTVGTTVKGKILDMSAIDDVVNFDGNQNSQSFSLTLDDTDGTIKAIYNTTDIHKRRCQVYQWFTGLNLNDAFLIFDGEINSPIVWKEGERTLSFNIVSKLEDQEVGFAPEEGRFASIPDDLIGKAFPLIFGVAQRVPCPKLDPIPAGILLDSLEIADPSILKQLPILLQKHNEFNGLAMRAFYEALYAYHTGMGVGSVHVDEYWQDVGDGFVDQGNGYLQQAWEAMQQYTQLVTEYAQQQAGMKGKLRVHNGQCFPGGAATTTLESGAKIGGEFQGSDFVINGIIHPAGDAVSFENVVGVPIQNASSTINSSIQFVQKLGPAFDYSDQPFKLTSALPVTYLCCMFSCTVLNVWAYRNYGDSRLLMQVPTEYYTVETRTFGSLPITAITLSKPLSYLDKKWDDSLYVDLQSSIGPNTVSIMMWLIENYTNKAIDSASFAHVASRVSGAPSNFALLQQTNVIKLLSDMAFQARCALLLKDDIFHLIYLPDEPVAVDTITAADILVDTLELNHTSTENLTTKMVSSWVPSYEGLKGNKIIIRNNIWKYGTHEQANDFYIYTIPGPVDVSTSFWAIRKSNTWKTIKFKTPLTKMRLETFDAVDVNLGTNWVCNGTVKGIVQSVRFDPKAMNLEIEVWLPVRLGEMTKYNFAWPPDSDVAVVSASLDFQKPGHDADGDLGPYNGATNCNRGGVKLTKGARERAQHPTTSTVDNGIILAPTSAGLDTAQPSSRPYTYNTPQPQPSAGPRIAQGVYPGTVVGGDPDSGTNYYRVRTYFRGLAGTGSITRVKDVTRGPTPSPGTWVAVIVVVWEVTETDGQRTRRTEKYFVPSSATNTFIGKVVSGSGSMYSVSLYPNGVNNSPSETVSVRQMQIDSFDSIPADSWCVVVRNTVTDAQSNTTQEYVMQFPIYVG